MQITFRFRVKDKQVARLKEPAVARGETFVAARRPENLTVDSFQTDASRKSGRLKCHILAGWDGRILCVSAMECLPTARQVVRGAAKTCETNAGLTGISVNN
jgi:hypothetical protein